MTTERRQCACSWVLKLNALQPCRRSCRQARGTHRPTGTCHDCQMLLKWTWRHVIAFMERGAFCLYAKRGTEVENWVRANVPNPIFMFRNRRKWTTSQLLIPSRKAWTFYVLMECVTKILLLYTDAASRILAVSPLTGFICVNTSICYVTLIVDCQRIHRVSQLLLLLFIAFFQGIYSYPFQTNHVCRVYNVAAILWSQCMVRGMLFPTINVFYFTLLICYYWGLE